MEVVIMYDQEKKKSRGKRFPIFIFWNLCKPLFLGFGFLSFEDDEAVERCVSEHFVNLNGKQVNFIILHDDFLC